MRKDEMSRSLEACFGKRNYDENELTVNSVLWCTVTGIIEPLCSLSWSRSTLRHFSLSNHRSIHLHLSTSSSLCSSSPKTNTHKKYQSSSSVNQNNVNNNTKVTDTVKRHTSNQKAKVKNMSEQIHYSTEPTSRTVRPPLTSESTHQDLGYEEEDRSEASRIRLLKQPYTADLFL